MQNKVAAFYLQMKLGQHNLAYLCGLRDAKCLKGHLFKLQEGWVIPIHFTYGMVIRNVLREGGFTEEKLGVKNLDDVYEQILNIALDQHQSKVDAESPYV